MDKDFSYGILMANRQIKLDVDPRRDDDASPMSSYIGACCDLLE